MSTRASHVLALFLGISLTIGFYEGRRLVVNTSRALQVAQHQLAGTSVQGQKRAGLRQSVEEQGPEAVALAREERQKLIAQRSEIRSEGRGAVDRVKTERLTRLQQQWREMAPEDRQAIRDRRQARAKKREAAGGALPDRPRRTAPAGEPRRDPSDKHADRDEPVLDTGLMVER